MQHRRAPWSWLVLALLVLVLAPPGNAASGTESPVAPEPGSGRVQHVVVAWLQEPGDAEARRRLIEASYDLADLPGVVAVSAGEPLAGDRPVVDDSFDVAIVFTFEDAAALQAYQTHPRHVRAQQEVLRPLTSRVLIYDFVE